MGCERGLNIAEVLSRAFLVAQYAGDLLSLASAGVYAPHVNLTQVCEETDPPPGLPSPEATTF